MTTRILRLLLLAALAWPTWMPAGAQEMKQDIKTYPAKVSERTMQSQGEISDVHPQPITLKTEQIETKLVTKTKKSSKNDKLKIDYFGEGTKWSNAGSPKLKASLKATPPANVIAKAEEWKISTNFYNVGASGFIDFGNTINVAIDGNDIYIQGLCLWLPDAWVQGTISGNTATFTKGQLFGTFVQNETNYDLILVGHDRDEDIDTDVVFNYNAAAHKLSLPENMLLLIGATSGGYYAYHINTVIAKEYVDPPVPVEVANGTKPSQIIPIYGAKYGSSTTSQMIYPSSMLSNFQDGQRIKSVTFYTNGDGIKFRNGQINATIGLTSDSYFTTSWGTVQPKTISGETATVTVAPVYGATSITFSFTTPLVYTAGSNIIIQLENTTTGNTGETTWFGVEFTGNQQYYSYSSRGKQSWLSSDEAERFKYLPKATFELLNPPISLTDELDFEVVQVGQSKTLIAYVENTNSDAVDATITATSPFSVASPVTLQPGVNTISVTFTPTGPDVYNGTLTIDIDGSLINIPLKGIGSVAGPEAIRDEAFFEGITYTWKENGTGTKHTSNLSEVATNPDQIIAMLKEVYTNKTIPGNFKRGYASGGSADTYSDVSYAGVGGIKKNGSNFTYDDYLGWNIPNKTPINNVTSGYYQFYYLPTTDYKPYNEGVTLLLVEMADDYDMATYTFPSGSGYDYLKSFVSTTIKSARVVTQSKRTGEGSDRGTLFKIDCDKMNKFFLLGKGQLRWLMDSYWAENSSGTSQLQYTACPEPCYIYNEYNSAYNGFKDSDGDLPLFSHMFEQFSPVNLDDGNNIDDLYQNLVNMQKFNVYHDCISVPFAYTSDKDTHGHQFMMYGVESGAADCQDVRDLMFFVPDYRMLTSSNRDNGNYQKFLNYHLMHQPSMALYVIRQDPVQAVTEADSYYKLKLTWKCNMDDFLPGEQQEYQLYQVVSDEFGISSWVPVYKRNAQGQYWNPTTNSWQSDTTGAEPVVLTLNPNDPKTYAEVYELRESSSRYVTYAIRGCDTGHFLNLQMSNEESYLIPGLDPAEMAMLSSATNYSRFEAQEVRNCYSNKIQVKSAPLTIKASYLPNGSTMTINRTHRVMDNNQSVEVTEPVATLTINTSNKKFTVAGSVLDASVEDLFPKGSNDNKSAGYHPNNLTNNQISYTTQTTSGVEYINFDISLWDNFVVDVSKNEHPGLYIYQLQFNTAENFEGLNGQTNKAYSNFFPVYVYKTDSQVNNALTLEQVNGDTDCSDDYKPCNVEFGAQVMLSSKTEILRYDAYRWIESANRSIIIDGGATDEDEKDAAPIGIAGNQGDSYSVTMNEIDTEYYYVGNPVSVSTAEPWNWATFVDYYPAKNPNAYIYAPVVELFTRGYQEGSTTKLRRDYNTYGGPLQDVAVGRLHYFVITPDKVNPLMSTHSWEVNGNKYAYYNIKLNVDEKKIPEEYEVYKIRAWREIPTELQGEEYSELSNRMGEKVLFEDLTYPNYSKADQYPLGSDTKVVPVIGADQATHNHTCYTGTFGARKLRTEGQDENGVIEELPYKFVVRIYFTKLANLDQTQPAQPRHIKSENNVVTNPDAKFYIAEYTIEGFFNSNNVPTAIQNINARQVAGVKYYNVAGVESDRPFKGVNIVVTRYSDGSMSTTKIVK